MELNEEQTQRRDSFLTDYKDLVAKYNFDFANVPVNIPDGQGGFRLIIQSFPMDTTKQPVESPFVKTDDKQS